jgi:hypothetical protein
MNETLQEFVDSRGVRMRLDRQNAVIRGVKILGVASRNGRSYLPEALAEAAALYEEAKVNVNHPKGNPLGARDYQDRIGVLRNVTARAEEGLFADFHFNPKHALAEQLIWDAEHTPENVGFSHNVQARTARRGDRVVVEAITKVQSVDLVADPATTRGLFESAADSTGERRDEAAGEAPRRLLADLTVEDLREHRPDLVDLLVSEQAAELAGLRAEMDRLEAAQALAAKRLLVGRLLREFNLPDPEAAQGWDRTVVSERFMESLFGAADEAAIREIVEERAALVRGAEIQGGPTRRPDSRPRSREQHEVYGKRVPDVKTFVEAIT